LVFEHGVSMADNKRRPQAPLPLPYPAHTSLGHVFRQFRYRSGISRRSASIIRDVIPRYLASSPSSFLSSLRKQQGKRRVEKHVVMRRPGILRYLPAVFRETRKRERYCPPTNVANSRVRQLDSMCNLIFMSPAGLAQIRPSLSHSSRYGISSVAFISNYRFYWKCRVPFTLPFFSFRGFLEVPEWLLKSAHSFDRIADEFIPASARFSFCD